MLFDQYGRPIPETRHTPCPPGVQIIGSPASDRETLDVSRGLTPRDVDRIMLQANGGDVEAQCRLARELPEKSHDIAHALRTRRNTLTGCDWHLEPGDDTPEAQQAAERLRADLDATGMLAREVGKLGSFRQLLRDLSDALLPGFAASEIVWKPGGAGFYGFRPIEQRFFSFEQGFTPRLRVDGQFSGGIELPPGKLVFHELGENGSDPARGGLIRPLAWLHCFSNINLKDLLSFIERYGMPFVVARVNQNAWEKEGTQLNNLITAFGPNGGGVFSKNTELELLQAANSTGDVYFKLLDYLGDAITKVILGQTASSGDAAGLSGGDAQSQVRQDILDADARQLEDTINRDLFAVWASYNCRTGVPAPRLAIDTQPPEDTAQLATTLKTLYEAGFQAEPEEIGDRFGLKLSRRPESAGEEISPAPEMPEPMTDRSAAQLDETLNLKQKYDAMGVAIRAGLLTATPEIEEQTRRELGLPPVSDAVRKAWEATGGIRQPITLKSSEAAAVSEALDVEAEQRAVEMAEPVKKKAPADPLSEWLGPIEAEWAALSGEAELSEEEFKARLETLASGEAFGDSTGFETALQNTVYTGIAHGIAAGYKRGRRKK